MVVGRNNGVVVLTGFSDKKMSGLLFGPQKSGRKNGVVVLTRWSYDGAPPDIPSDWSILTSFVNTLASSNLMRNAM